jgi:hypothetical protein
MVVIVTCLLSTGVAVNAVCYANIEQWLPAYPNGTVESTTSNFIPRGLGLTLLIMRSPDDPDTARRFYGQMQRDMDSKHVWRGIARTFFEVEPDADSSGSVIFLTSKCGQ